jgi:hypothetical protein
MTAANCIKWPPTRRTGIFSIGGLLPRGRCGNHILAENAKMKHNVARSTILGHWMPFSGIGEQRNKKLTEAGLGYRFRAAGGVGLPEERSVCGMRTRWWR